jgi:hypothetical protein
MRVFFFVQEETGEERRGQFGHSHVVVQSSPGEMKFALLQCRDSYSAHTDFAIMRSPPRGCSRLPEAELKRQWRIDQHPEYGDNVRIMDRLRVHDQR